jgi:hypothetical protein
MQVGGPLWQSISSQHKFTGEHHGMGRFSSCLRRLGSWGYGRGGTPPAWATGGQWRPVVSEAAGQCVAACEGRGGVGGRDPRAAKP